jgi:2-oxoisovalerate dehydrogenase E1 component
MKDLKVPKIHTIKKTDKETLEKWYRLMTIGRALDEKAPNYLKQAIGWSYHAPYAGHDGIQLALGQVFEKKKDHMFLYYRDMLSALSAGLTTEEVILNGISKATDPSSGGRHMSNHFAKPEFNIHSVSSLTGNHTLHAVGVARAIKYYGEEAVAFSSQGESSVSEGFVYEAFNGADKEELPVVFVVQDNGYGISVPKKDQTAQRKVANNFSGFKNLRIIHCNGKDVFDSMNAMAEAKRYAMKESKPVIVQANCVRIHSHSNSDDHLLYRSESERNYVMDYDPLGKYRRMLLRYERFTEEELQAIEEESRLEIKTAHKAALKAPDPKPESVFDFVLPEPYAAEKYPDGLHRGEGDKKKLITALNETLKAEFSENPDTFMWGQDMANKDKGGIFNVSKGMQKEFGSKRIFNAPIAEDFIVGTANGMSRYNDKIRIVIEGAEFADYFWPAMEQYVECSQHDQEEEEYTDDMMDDIKIVPNPFYLTSQAQVSPYENKIFITKLPRKATIDIYTINGDHIETINHDEYSSSEPDKVAVEIWDMLTKNGFRVQSQVLVAVITGPDGAQTVQQFTVVVGPFRIQPE